MNLNELDQLLTLRDKRSYDPSTLAQFNAAVGEKLGSPVSEGRLRRWTFIVGAWIFFAYTIVTGVIAVGATLKLFPYDERAFHYLWLAFGSGFGTLMFGVLRRAWTWGS